MGVASSLDPGSAACRSSEILGIGCPFEAAVVVAVVGGVTVDVEGAASFMAAAVELPAAAAEVIVAAGVVDVSIGVAVSLAWAKTRCNKDLPSKGFLVVFVDVVVGAVDDAVRYQEM